MHYVEIKLSIYKHVCMYVDIDKAVSMYIWMQSYNPVCMSVCMYVDIDLDLLVSI